MAMTKPIEAAMALIKKQYGEESVMKMGDRVGVPIDVISTGIISADYILGVGGMPRGRMVELYGPPSSGKTTLALHTVCEAQKMGLHCAYIDTEQAMDITYAASLGVDVDELYMSQPDSGEEAMAIAEIWMMSGDIGLIIVDSIDAMVPKVLLDSDFGAERPGLTARMMSQGLRKLKGITKRANTCLIFINQIRKAVMQTHGCLHSDTLVNFIDGRSMPIKTVVEGRIEGKVWAYSESTKSFHPAPITGWHHNGHVSAPEDYIHIQTEAVDSKGGRFGLTVTPSHEVLTLDGWRAASSVTLQDRLISRYIQQVNGPLEDFLAGILVGDSCVTIRSSNTACLRLQDRENPEYIQWKISKLSPFFQFRPVGNRWETPYNYEWSLIKKELGERDMDFLINRSSPLGLAIWVMDDGHLQSGDREGRYIISAKRLNSGQAARVKVWLSEMGVECRVDYPTTFNVSAEGSRKIASLIASYIPDCMQYKLPVPYRGLYKEFNLSNEPRVVGTSVGVVSIRNASERQMRQTDKYDLTVEGYHNYMVGGATNGVVVHNSPEYTPGGDAIKFYTSMRVEVRRSTAIKDREDDTQGFETRIKVVKNKVAPPFKECMVNMAFGTGIDKNADILKLGIETGVLDQTGRTVKWGENKMGVGKDAVKAWMEENDDDVAIIVEEIKKAKGMNYDEQHTASSQEDS